MIFGAGASYDSSTAGPGLPLVKELIAPSYDPIAAHYPPSRAVISHVRRQINDDSAVSLERALANFEANAAPTTGQRKRPEADREHRPAVEARIDQCRGNARYDLCLPCEVMAAARNILLCRGGSEAGEETAVRTELRRRLPTKRCGHDQLDVLMAIDPDHVPLQVWCSAGAR
jgi:hypothetical protein